MSTAETRTAAPDELLPGDLEAAERHFIEGTPFEAGLARRIRGHVKRVSEEMFRTRGMIDQETMDRLLRDDRE